MEPARGSLHRKGTIYGALDSPGNDVHLACPWIGFMVPTHRGRFTSFFTLGASPGLVCFSLGSLECLPVVPIHKPKEAQSQLNLFRKKTLLRWGLFAIGFSSRLRFKTT